MPWSMFSYMFDIKHPLLIMLVLRHAKPLTRLPLIGPLLIPPVNVTSVAKVAVRAAVDPAFPSGVVDVYGILQYSQQNPA